MTEAQPVRRTRADIDRIAGIWKFPEALVESAIKNGRIVVEKGGQDGSKNRN